MKKNREAGQMVLEGTAEVEMLTRLQERVERAVATIGALKKERDELRKRLDDAETQVREHGDARDRLTEVEEANEKYETEREEIRNRIESLLDKLDALEEEEGE